MIWDKHEIAFLQVTQILQSTLTLLDELWWTPSRFNSNDRGLEVSTVPHVMLSAMKLLYYQCDYPSR